MSGRQPLTESDIYEQVAHVNYSSAHSSAMLSGNPQRGAAGGAHSLDRLSTASTPFKY